MEKNKKVYIVVRETEQSDYTEPRYWMGANPYTDILMVTDTRQKAEDFVRNSLVWKEGDEESYFEYRILEAQLNERLCG